MLSNSVFEIKNEDEDYVGLHKDTGVQVIQMFEQKINPVEQYNYQLMQYHNLNTISNYDFYAIEKIDSSLIMRIRRLLYYEWIAFQQNENVLIWGIPPTEDSNNVKVHHDKIRVLGLDILKVKPEDAKSILDNCQKDLVPSSWMYTSDISHISFPIMLNKRTFWLSKELSVTKKHDFKKLIELLEFKYSFEHKFGFDNMLGKTEQQINSEEIKHILFDLFTFRGSRMLDISTFQNPISINIRFREGKINSSNDLALEYITEFNKIYETIKNMLN